MTTSSLTKRKEIIMNITSNEVQTREIAVEDIKKQQNAYKKLFKAGLEDGSVDDLAYDKDGNLLTNTMFFNGMPRPPAGSGKKVKSTDVRVIYTDK